MIRLRAGEDGDKGEVRATGDDAGARKGGGRHRRAALGILSILAVLAAGQFAVLASHGSFAIDDAYISYRYAANLAAGDGLVFNPGERVQGFTNPLYTLLLGAAAAAGADIPRAALGLGLAGLLAALLGLAILHQGLVWRWAALVGGLVLLLSPAFVLNALSGMETMLFCALLMISLLAYLRGRVVLLGIALALLMMTRPDGALWAGPLIAGFFLIDRRGATRVFLIAFVLYVSWLVFAWAYYGSPVPQSILAKRLIHPAPLGLVLRRYVEFLTRGWALEIATAMAALGLIVTIVARRREWVVGVAAVIYVLGMSASQVMPLEVPRPFFWYAVPVIPVMIYLSLRGVTIITQAVAGRRRAAVRITIVSVLLMPLLGAALLAQLRLRSGEIGRLRAHFAGREALYAATAQAIRKHAPGGGAGVLVGEVGVLGYYLQGLRVYDSSGINSRAIYEFRRRDREAAVPRNAGLARLSEGTSGWVMAFLLRRQPDFVTTMRPWLHIDEIEADPWFTALYEPIEQDTVWKGKNTLFALRSR